MPDYSKCIIYTIRTPTGLYVGSTCNYTNRKYAHKNNIHNETAKSYNFKLYKNIRENNDEWEMKPYSEFPCKNKMEMTIEEERVRRELNADLNSYSCCGLDKEKRTKTLKQYNQNNKEKNKEYQKEYNKLNNEKLTEQKKQYRENNKEKLSEYKQKNKEKIAEFQKQYYQDNKEKIAVSDKEYREKNKEKIAERTKQWRENNKESIAEYQKQYREKKKAEQIN